MKNMSPSPAAAVSDIGHSLNQNTYNKSCRCFDLLLRAHEESNITCSVYLLDRLVRFAPNRVAKAFRFLVDLSKLTKPKALALDFVFCGPTRNRTSANGFGNRHSTAKL